MKARLRAVLRLGAFLVTVHVALSATFGFVARVRAGEVLAAVGDEWFRRGWVDASKVASTVFINGLSLRVVAASTSSPADRVLDDLASRCRRQNAWLSGERRRAVGPWPEMLLRTTPAWLDGVVRFSRPHGGIVACLDTKGVGSNSDALVDGIRTFLASGDLSRVGALRFARVERRGGETLVVIVTSEGAIDLMGLFPARGDAPGGDIPGVPRPRGSRRLLSVGSDARGPSLAAYSLPARPPTLAIYLSELDRAGWNLRGQGPSAAAVVLEKDGRLLLIDALTGEDGAETVSLSRLD